MSLNTKTMKRLKTTFLRSTHSLPSNNFICVSANLNHLIQYASMRTFSQKKSRKRAKWKIVQMSTHIMRQEAQRRGEVIRALLISGYKLR